MSKNEKVEIRFEATKRELLEKADRILTAITKLADGIYSKDFSGNIADLETDVLSYAASIKTLSETAQTYVSYAAYASGEL